MSELNLDTINIHHPQRYAQGFPWKEWDLLRDEAPIFWYERDDIEPFWAVTRYDDVMEVSSNPEIFINGGPRLRLTLKGEAEVLREGLDDFGQERNWDPNEPADFIFMDNPRHRHMRKLSSWAYTQSNMRGMTKHFEELARTFTQEFEDALSEPANRESGVDMVSEFAAKLPLAAVGEIMGLAPDDWKQILIWSNAVIGEVEPEHLLPGETVAHAARRNMYDFRLYLEELIQECRENGAERGGMIDRMVHTPVQGKLLTDQQLIGYLFVLIAAGNDTTRNATAGGIAALMENPTQLQKLHDYPSLIPQATEEILRWTSPVINFLRTAIDDYDLAGTKIKAGDTVGVFYPSANRDERVFEDPYEFNITRDPNPHITFGFGAHFCLGTNLARAELNSSLKAILPLLPRLEKSGPGHLIGHAHVTGGSRSQSRRDRAPDRTGHRRRR
ncbi:MAG: cytochrome P450, partial [Pseudomonadota bacterium]